MSAAGAISTKSGNAPCRGGVVAQQHFGQEKRQPAAHAGTHNDAFGLGLDDEHVNGLFKPGGNGAIGEQAGGLAVARIVKAQAGPPGFPGKGRQGFRLGALHVRHEAPQPEKAAAAQVIGGAILEEGQSRALRSLLKIHICHLNYPIHSALLDGGPASRSIARFLNGQRRIRYGHNKEKHTT